MPEAGPNGLAVIFDLDGVLVDSYDAHLQSWLDLGREFGARMTAELFPSTFGRTSLEIIRDLWGPGLQDETALWMYRRKEELFRESLLTTVQSKPGAVELIDALVEAGYVLAVGSSAPPVNVRLSLERIGRSHAFTSVVTGADVTIGKPDPRVFLLAARRVGCKPGQCAVVEDSVAGITAARSAGMCAIALTGTNTAERLHHAHHVVDSLRDLTPETISEWLRRHAAESPR